MTGERDLDVRLDGLVELLARHLYADPELFVRELVQNAHDAIVRRGRPGSVRIRVEGDALVFEDDGAGLTPEEVEAHLSTIGRSGTAEAARALAGRDPEAAARLVGRFGVGLLSALSVADEVVVETRAEGAPAVRWRCTRRGRWRAEPGARAEVGTAVRLRPRPEARRALDPDRLRALVRRWADFLEVPVHVGDDPAPANAGRPPWRDGEAAVLRWWRARRSPPEPLAARLLRPDRDGVEGALVLLDGRAPAGGGAVDVFVRRMLVARACPELLPPWASFVRGLVEAPELVPNAARDDVLRDDAFRRLAGTLARALVDWLAEIAETDLLGRLARLHGRDLLLAARSDDRLLERAGDRLPLPGLPEAPPLADRGPEVAVLGPELAPLAPLARAAGIPHVDATDPAVEAFLDRLARRRPALRLRRLEERDLLRPAEDPRWARLLAAAPPLPGGARLAVSEFAPAGLPALLVERPGAAARRRLAAADLPGAMRAALGGLLARRGGDAVLHLNALHPLAGALLRALPGRRGADVLLLVHEAARAGDAGGALLERAAAVGLEALRAGEE